MSNNVKTIQTENFPLDLQQKSRVNIDEFICPNWKLLIHSFYPLDTNIIQDSFIDKEDNNTKSDYFEYLDYLELIWMGASPILFIQNKNNHLGIEIQGLRADKHTLTFDCQVQYENESLLFLERACFFNYLDVVEWLKLNLKKYSDWIPSKENISYINEQIESKRSNLELIK